MEILQRILVSIRRTERDATGRIAGNESRVLAGILSVGKAANLGKARCSCCTEGKGSYLHNGKESSDMHFDILRRYRYKSIDFLRAYNTMCCGGGAEELLK
jgi:hypothetical protein